MTISKLTINDQTYKNQDFLDLVLSLQDDTVNRIVVHYKEDLSKTTEYIRNIHNTQWYMIRDKGRISNQRIRVAKENRQHIIQYI